ncbi:MAG: hypothetical protein AB9858_04825 [Acidaminococcaceae bacterium]
MEEHYSKIVQEKVNNNDQIKLRYIIDEAYKLVNAFYAKNTNMAFLNSVGRDLRADIIRVFIAEVASKVYPANSNATFKTAFKKNHIGNCHHIELDCDDITLLFALATSRTDVGHDSIYRRNLLDNRLQSLFSLSRTLEENIKALLVTYGVAASDEPNFVVLGIPGQKGWLGRIPLIKPSKKNSVNFMTEEEEEESIAKLSDDLAKGDSIKHGGKIS